MNGPVEVSYHHHHDSAHVSVAAKINQQHMLIATERAIISEIVQRVAERYVQENYTALIASLDPQAIANLAIADAGKKIAEEIRLKPTVIREKENLSPYYCRLMNELEKER